MAKVKELEISLGLTVEVNKKWIRPQVGLKLEVDTENTTEKRKALYAKGFDELSNVLDGAIEELLK